MIYISMTVQDISRSTKSLVSNMATIFMCVEMVVNNESCFSLFA